MRERGEVIASESVSPDTAVRAYTTLSEAARSATRLSRGDVLIDRYEIGETLGMGGMGVVFEAFDRVTREKIAVKVLRGDVGLTAPLQSRFLAEGKVSRTLSHENIVRIHDVGSTQDFYYLTMERLWGQSLRARMQELSAAHQPFSLSEFHSILSQLIEALRFANRTVVHRDVKPENIWITREGVVKLMDFGIARVFVDSNQSFTQAIIGTPHYMSPEQNESPKSVDWRTDQYALGVLLHEMLIGKRPEFGMRPPSVLRKDIPRSLSNAIVMALAPEPEDRHPTWQAFKEAFERHQMQRHPPWQVGAAGLLLAATIGGAYLVFESGIFEPAERSPPQSPPTATQERDDAASQAELERQQRAAEAATQKAAAESQAQLSRERQVAEAQRQADAQRAAAAAQREADALRAAAAAQREADALRAAAQRRADAKRQAETKRRLESERRAEAERQTEAERQAQLERERQAAQALVVPPPASPPPENKATDDKDKKDKKNKRSLEGGFIPPSF